jgi:hypothetical protein
MELDTNVWRLRHTNMFSYGREELYDALVFELKQYSRELSAIWKELQSQSETFPLLNSVQLMEWLKFVNIVSD